jgi:hypothetical protein
VLVSAAEWAERGTYGDYEAEDGAVRRVGVPLVWRREDVKKVYLWSSNIPAHCEVPRRRAEQEGQVKVLSQLLQSL